MLVSHTFVRLQNQNPDKGCYIFLKTPRVPQSPLVNKKEVSVLRWIKVMHLESLIRSSYQKVIDAYIKFVQHPWPKRWPVKFDQLSNLDRLPFWTRLAIANSTIVFLFSGHLKERSLPVRKCFDKTVLRIFNQAGI